MKLALTNHTFQWALEPLGLRPDLLSRSDNVEALVSDILRAEQRVATVRATDLVADLA